MKHKIPFKYELNILKKRIAEINNTIKLCGETESDIVENLQVELDQIEGRIRASLKQQRSHLRLILEGK